MTEPSQPTDPFAAPSGGPGPVTWTAPQTGPARPGRTALWVALAGVGALLVGIALGAALTTAYDKRDEVGTAISDIEARSSGTTALDELEPGMCFDELPASADDTLIDAVQSRSCTTPHQFQVYATITYKQIEYPGDDAIEDGATEQCYAAYDANDAISEATVEDQVHWYSPTAETWAAGDRGGVCFLSGPSAPLTSPFPVADPRA